MRIVSAIGVACLGLYLGACSDSSPDGSNSIIVPAPSPARPIATSNAETGSANSGQPVQDVSNKFDPIKGRRRPRTAVVSRTQAPLDFRAGPENSETATTMNDHGQPVEVRIFKDNPQLERVEAVWLGPSEKLLKIMLRNGSTVEVKTDKIANLASASSDLLIELAGGPK